MKLLFENWRQYLKENEGEEVPAIVTFDFDSTLSLSHWGEEEDDWVHDGPYQKMIDTLMDHHKQGTKIYIVTSRHKEVQDENGNWFTFSPNRTPPRKYIEDYQTAVWAFVKKHGLPIQDVIFTNGELKAKAEDGLVELGSDIHYDDDPEEIHAANIEGIKTVIADTHEQERIEKWEASAPQRKSFSDEIKDRIKVDQLARGKAK